MSTPETNSSAPWHMWVIGIVLFINSAIGTVGYLATVFRYDPYISQFPAEALAYYLDAPLWMYVMWSISIIGGLFSSILLLMRRRLSLPVGIFAWFGSAIAVIYTILNPPPTGANTLFSIAIILIVLLVLFYMRWLTKRGVLR